MLKKRLPILLLVLAAVILLVVLFRDDDAPAAGIQISPTYCLSTDPDLQVATEDQQIRQRYINCCLVDTFTHFYVKSVIYRQDTLTISTLNETRLRDYLYLYEGRQGRLIQKSQGDHQKGSLHTLTSIPAGFLSRYLIEEPAFNSCIIIDYFTTDSLRAASYYQQHDFSKLIRKCI